MKQPAIYYAEHLDELHKDFPVLKDVDPKCLNTGSNPDQYLDCLGWIEKNSRYAAFLGKKYGSSLLKVRIEEGTKRYVSEPFAIFVAVALGWKVKWQRTGRLPACKLLRPPLSEEQILVEDFENLRLQIYKRDYLKAGNPAILFMDGFVPVPQKRFSAMMRAKFLEFPERYV